MGARLVMGRKEIVRPLGCLTVGHADGDAFRVRHAERHHAGVIRIEHPGLDPLFLQPVHDDGRFLDSACSTDTHEIVRHGLAPLGVSLERQR